MGFTTALKEVTSFIYKAPFDNGLTEHEFDHVMTGFYEMDPVINKEEVEAWKWMPVEAVKSDIESNSEIYTAWFKIIFKNFYTHINSER
jgi:isopentenyl-diphosphate delta-isomerase